MITHPFVRFLLLVASLTLLASPGFAGVTKASLADWPLQFEANQGQTRDDVKFLAHGSGYGVYLTANEAVLALSAQTPVGCAANDAPSERERVLRMKLRGSAKAPAVRAVDEQPGKANYLIGNDASQWHTNIPTYAKVRYDEVYPGIDIVYYGNQRQLEYDFVLAPGADPGSIDLQFEGADRVEIDANGDLVLHACGREIRQSKPVVYQEADGRREVEGRYVRKGKNRIGFAVTAYDRKLPLVIDPVLVYGTYFGGKNRNSGNGITVDTQGAAYVTGVTVPANDFPVTAGAYQTTFANTSPTVFVSKFNADGSLSYSTYLSSGGNDSAGKIAVDSAGSAYVIGSTDRGSTFPTTPGAYREASVPPPPSTPFNPVITNFLTKLNPTGSALVYSTLFYIELGTDIAVNATGEAYVASAAPWLGFTADTHKFYVTKFNATGSALVYSSPFAPGTTRFPMSMALDSSGNAYVGGTTDQPNFPVTSGAFQTARRGLFDPFVTKLGASGEIVYSTLLGGTEPDTTFAPFSHDEAAGIAVDSGNNAYLIGLTDALDFPTTRGAYRTAPGPGFVTKLNPTGSALVYSSYLGGAGVDIAVDANGRAYVARGEDDFMTVIEPSGSAASVSGVSAGHPISASDERLNGIAVDSAGRNVWVVGATNADDFPTTSNAYQAQHVLSGSPLPDVFLAKFTTDGSTVPGTILAANFDYGGEGPAYHENTPGNQGDAGFRTSEDVDIFVSNDAAVGSYVIKNFEPGEWLDYTINVPADGQYTIELRAATSSEFPNPSYYADIDDVNVTGIVTLPDTGGWDHYQWVGKRTVALTAGVHQLKIVVYAPYFALSAISVAQALVSAPYYNAPAALPGQIEAETFDAGGEGPAYHENTPGNQGNAYFRTGEDVDVFVTTDTSSGSWYTIQNFEQGEWLAYTVNVPAAGSYDIELRAATSPDFPNASYYADIDGRNVTGLVTLGNTGGFNTFAWIGKKTVTLPAGIHELKIVAGDGYMVLNTIRITPTSGRLTRPYYGAPSAVPGVIEAEAFDNGSESGGSHDNTPGNQGNSGIRPTENVDIFVTNDATSGSPYIVKNFEAGEWLAYTIEVAAGGSYDVELRAATSSDFPNSSYYVQIDGSNVTGPVVLPDTGGWDNYQWIGKRTIALPAGVHVLTVVSLQPYFGFNALRVTPSAQ